jgi:hypothetical protein
MGRTPEEIESHIENEREQLRSNLEELENKVKSLLDWRRQFRRNPALGLGLAAGAGFLIAGMTSRPARGNVAHRTTDGAGGTRNRHLRQVWGTVQSTLVGIATATATDFLTAALRARSDRVARYGRDTPATEDAVQGEGDYRAARRYRRSAEAYVRTGDIKHAARDAAPRTRAEAEDMAAAEAQGRERAKA